jgi:hypothetical protein
MRFYILVGVLLKIDFDKKLRTFISFEIYLIIYRSITSDVQIIFKRRKNALKLFFFSKFSYSYTDRSKIISTVFQKLTTFGAIGTCRPLRKLKNRFFNLYNLVTSLLLEHEWEMDGFQPMKVVHGRGPQFNPRHGAKEIRTFQKIGNSHVT